MLSGGTSLRRTSMVSIALMATAAFVASASLILLTTLLHDSSQSLDAAVHGLRLVEKVETELLLVDRTEDAPARATIVAALRRDLDALRHYVSGDEESSALVRAHERIERYLDTVARSPGATPERAAALESSYGVLEELV